MIDATLHSRMQALIALLIIMACSIPVQAQSGLQIGVSVSYLDLWVGESAWTAWYRLSQLDWTTKNAWLAETNIALPISPTIRCNAQISTRFTNGKSRMVDRDWLVVGVFEPSHISHHVAPLKRADSVNIAGEWDFMIFDKNTPAPSAFAVGMGYFYSLTKWETRGGTLHYPNFYQVLPEDLLGIDYEQETIFPYASFSFRTERGRWQFKAEGYRAMVPPQVRVIDNHYLRGITFSSIILGEKTTGCNLDVRYLWTPRLQLTFGFHSQWMNLSRGMLHVVGDGMDFFVHGAEGAEYRRQTFSAGLMYQF